MIHAIVFDIGGVLLKTEDRTFRQNLADRYGLKPADMERIVFDSQTARASTLGQEPEAAVWQNVAAKLQLSPEAIEGFRNIFFDGDQVDQELVQFLQGCRPHYKTALLSNAWEGARFQLAEKYGIKEGETVDRILFSYELGVAKPDPKIYQILADTVECEFDQILFVDDFIENVIAANELGIHTVHYQPGIDLISKIKKIINLS
ncbi:MAG: HAD-IA family hydrolase [Brevefilum sp.]